MNKPETYVVSLLDQRLARMDGTCYYCGESIGGVHKKECVLRTKTCVVEFTVRMVVSVPECWEKENIESYYNGGSWCADNLMTAIKNREANTGRCLCDIATAKFVREATEADEKAFGYDPTTEGK